MRPTQVSTATPPTTHEWTELASREGDGLEVWLHWSTSTGETKVTVVDGKLDERFEFDVAGADALAAFYHPFAYAPSSSFGSVEAVRESHNLQQQA